ncbi:MAG: LCP family protein [bacterium]
MTGNPVRKIILYGAAGAMLGAVGLLVWVLVATQDQAAWPSDGGTLLWVIEGATGDGLGADSIGILSLSPTGAAVVFVPEDVSVKGRDGRLIELGDLGADCGWGACCRATEMLLGIPVVGYVVLQARDVAAFLDALGPIPIELLAPVRYRETPDGGASIDIGRGERELSGTEILAYVQGASEREAAPERRARALRAILAAAEASAGEADETETARRVLSRMRSNLGANQVWSVWQDLSRKGVALKISEVPTSVMVRDGVGRRVAMVVETEKLVASAVRARSLLTPDEISVTIFNGSGVRLAATRAAEYLQVRGFRVVRIGNADVFTYATSYVVRLTEEPKAWILRDTLPGAAKIVSPGEFATHYEALRPMVPLGTDLVLVVGAGMEFGE